MHRSFARHLANLAAVSIAVATAACGTPVVSFDVPITAETTITGGGGVIDQLLGTLGFEGLNNVKLEDTREFENNNVQREQVTSARLTTLTLTIVAPQGANFDWLDQIAFSVEAPDVATQRVASKVIANGSVAVALDIDDVDLVEFVRQANMSMTTEADARRPPQDTTIRVDLNLAISAKVL